MLYHGINIGHGYVKYVAIDEAGRELPAVVFPALIAPSEGAVLGALDAAPVSTVRGQGYWTGEDALISGHPRSMLTQERLQDSVFLAALVKGALARLGATCAEALAGVAVTGSSLALILVGPDGTLRAHCFACSAGGDAFSLIAAGLGLDVRTDFASVLAEAAARAGIALPTSEQIGRAHV